MEVISRRRVPAARKAAIVLAALALIALGAVVWLNSGMRTAMRALAVARVSAVTARAMNEAILERMAEQNGSEKCSENTELCCSTEEQSLRVSNQRTEVGHRADTHEDERRENTEFDSKV